MMLDCHMCGKTPLLCRCNKPIPPEEIKSQMPTDLAEENLRRELSALGMDLEDTLREYVQRIRRILKEKE